MLTVFIGGTGYYKRKEETLLIRPPMAGIVPPQDAGLLYSGQDDPYDHFYCRFTGGYGKFLADEILRRRGRRFFTEEGALKLADSLRKMGKCNRRTPPELPGGREVLLLNVLVLLLGEDRLAEQRLLNAETLSAYLEERIDRKADLDEIAAFFRMSRSSLCRRVKKETGTTVQRIHERIKMDWAMSLLSLGGLRVGEAAERLGYSDPFYFSRVFSKHAGVSPKQWQMRQDCI